MQKITDLEGNILVIDDAEDIYIFHGSEPGPIRLRAPIGGGAFVRTWINLRKHWRGDAAPQAELKTGTAFAASDDNKERGLYLEPWEEGRHCLTLIRGDKTLSYFFETANPFVQALLRGIEEDRANNPYAARWEYRDGKIHDTLNLG